jgi:hypothetical protein
MPELREPPLSRIEQVVLVRISPAKGATTAEIIKALHEIGLPLAEPARAECATAALAALQARGWATRPPKAKKASAPRFRLTDDGRATLGRVFASPPSWPNMRDRMVPALALGEVPESEAATRALASAEAMVATLLRRDRTLGEVAAVGELCDRVIARALGMPPGPITPAAIRAYALALHCGVSSQAELEAVVMKAAKTVKKKTAADAALTALGERLALGMNPPKKGAKAAVLRSLRQRWVSQHDASDDAQRPSTLRASPVRPPPDPDGAEPLLIAVRAAIPLVGADGRYGRDNVFVWALWQRVRDGRQSELSLDSFKRWLVTANRNQQLALARADMIDDMDADLVESSEIEDLGATFHFVLDRRDALAAPRQVHHG